MEFLFLVCLYGFWLDGLCPESRLGQRRARSSISQWHMWRLPVGVVPFHIRCCSCRYAHGRGAASIRDRASIPNKFIKKEWAGRQVSRLGVMARSTMQQKRLALTRSEERRVGKECRSRW